jgi:hypothetical protein
LLLAAYGPALGPNELVYRRPRYGYTQDGAQFLRHSVLRSRVL